VALNHAALIGLVIPAPLFTETWWRECAALVGVIATAGVRFVFGNCLGAGHGVDYVGRKFGALFDAVMSRSNQSLTIPSSTPNGKRGIIRPRWPQSATSLINFRRNFEGQMLLRTSGRRILNDLPEAEITIQRWPVRRAWRRRTSRPLQRLADWHLNLKKDRDSAQKALEKNNRIIWPDIAKLALPAASALPA